MTSRRQLRVAEQVKRTVGQILKRGAKDPRIGFVSVMGVEVSPDLKNARIFISIYGDEKEREKTLQGLGSARSYIQRELGSCLQLRYTPIISFHLDDSIEQVLRIEEMIKKLHERDARLEEESEKNESSG